MSKSTPFTPGRYRSKATGSCWYCTAGPNGEILVDYGKGFVLPWSRSKFDRSFTLSLATT